MNTVPRNGIEVAIVADDLTGAADCAAVFAAAGRRPLVLLEPRGDRRDVPDGCDVVALTANSRDIGPRDAGDAIADAVHELAALAPQTWFKKIDSTLRGHLGEELAIVTALLEPELTIVSPAFPRTGRILRGGRACVHGLPLEQTLLWREAGGGVAHLPSMLARTDTPPVSVGITELRSGAFASSLCRAAQGTVLVVDAETDADLDLLIESGRECGRKVLWVGSAGLASALANALESPANDADTGDLTTAGPDESTGPRVRVPAGGPILVVAGSAAQQTQRQLAELGHSCDATLAILPVDALLDRDRDALRAIVELLEIALAGGLDAVVAIEPPTTRTPRPRDAELASRLGALVGEVATGFRGLVLTGGDTARAVLQAVGITQLRVVGSVGEGIPVSRATPTGHCVVTKAGAFGDVHSLSRAVQLLRAWPGDWQR